MRNIIMLILLVFYVSAFSANGSNSLESSDSTVTKQKSVIVTFHPSLGLTLNQSKAEGINTSDIQWLASLNSDFDYLGSKFQLSSNLFIQYGQLHTTGNDPVVNQDAFIWSVTPSIPLFKLPLIRLFLETTAETQLGKGTIDSKETSFLDPLFLYQTLFLGQRHYVIDKGGKTTWEITYGLGYAFQQTVNKNFAFTNSENNADFETGFSGIFETSVNSKINDYFDFSLNLKAVALSRQDFFANIESSRNSVLLQSGIYYKKIGIEYVYHLTHDLNISSFNQIDQSLMLTLKF